jgi:tryptophanase
LVKLKQWLASVCCAGCGVGLMLLSLLPCSGKKEALANVGGLLCCNDDTLYEQLRNLTIVVEGYPTYGGLACRHV